MQFLIGLSFGKVLRTSRSSVWLLLILWYCLPVPADTNLLVGKIFNPQGVPVVGAQVTLTNAAGNVVRQTRSGAQGDFVLENIAANFLISQGYVGQTTEVLSYPTGSAPFERVVGVPLKSYVSLSWTYYFKK